MTRAPARVRLKKNLTRAIAGGQPWIWRDAFAGAPRFADGTVVTVENAAGRPLGRGFWDARSPIAVRVLTTGSARENLADVVADRAAETLARKLAMIDRAETDAFRWIHGEADRLPGVHADVYGAAVVVRYDGDGARAFHTGAGLPEKLRAAGAAAGLRVDSVLERQRGEEAGARTLLGAEPPAGEVEIREHGLRFGVDLRRGQKGGLFLDQRENRALVRTLARDRRVLNLFGYTGGFSIYAAAGGARETVTVDAAAPAIAAASRNFERNALPLAQARLVTGDAFEFLANAVSSRQRFELVISDPPAFAPNRRALDAGLRAYRRLHRLAAEVTAPGGLLCAASCSSHVDRAAFLATVQEGARDAGRRFTLRELRGAGPDHPVIPAFPEGDYLKFAVGVLE